MKKSKVYFSKSINPNVLVRLYETLGKKLPGNVAVKLHTGEKGNQNFIKPEFFKSIIDFVQGTVVECNTAYSGQRNETDKHKKLIDEHGWTKYFNVDIMDDCDEDICLPIPNGKIIQENFVGNHLQKYDSMLVLSHFKGHPMGGFGGALKQLSIGCASSRGKSWIHSGGVTKDQNILWGNLAKQNDFLQAMAESASSITSYFKNNIVFINIMANMSVDCDCCAVAEDPCLQDVGILASLDPVALDKACLDLVYSSKDEGKEHFIERVESRNGVFTIECAEKLGIGTTNYEIINID